MTSHERKVIAQKIASKIPFSDILDEIRDSVTNCELERIHLLNRKDLYNIEQSFKLNSLSVRHQNDAISVEAWVNDTQHKKSVLFYKPQNTLSDEYSFLKKEDFLLVIMNEGQKEVLDKYGDDCVCVDGTHGLNKYDFQLHTQLVIDDVREGFPCAFLIASRANEDILELFFCLITAKLERKLETKTFMSDMAAEYYNAWEKAVGPVNQR